MKRRGWSRGLILAAIVVTVANAVSLLGVARNRARRLQTIELTERELPIAYRPEDNSGIELRFTLASDGPLAGLGLEWLDAVKLRISGLVRTPRSFLRDASIWCLNMTVLPGSITWSGRERAGPIWARGWTLLRIWLPWTQRALLRFCWQDMEARAGT